MYASQDVDVVSRADALLVIITALPLYLVRILNCHCTVVPSSSNQGSGELLTSSPGMNRRVRSSFLKTDMFASASKESWRHLEAKAEEQLDVRRLEAEPGAARENPC